MPTGWTDKRERQYQHVNGGLKDPTGPTRKQLYAEAKRKGIEGRSMMNKAQLQRAVDRH